MIHHRGIDDLGGRQESERERGRDRNIGNLAIAKYIFGWQYLYLAPFVGRKKKRNTYNVLWVILPDGVDL